MNRGHSLELWALIAVVSPTSELVSQFVAVVVPDWLLWFRIAVLVAVLIVGAYRTNRPVRP
jgi:hypothetical protein